MCGADENMLSRIRKDNYATSWKISRTAPCTEEKSNSRFSESDAIYAMLYGYETWPINNYNKKLKTPSYNFF